MKIVTGLLLTMAFSLSGQVLLKKGVMAALNGEKPGIGAFLRDHLFAVLFSPLTLCGLMLSGIGVVCWLFVLSSADLSKAIPVLGGMGYIVLFIVGRVILKEESNWANFAGILLIIGGLGLLSVKSW